MDTMKNHHVSQRWSAWIVRHAQAVLVVTLLICTLLVPLAITSTQHTVPDGWLPDSADAVQVQQLGAEQFGRSDTTYYLLFQDPTGKLAANDAAFVQQVQFAVRPFRAMDGVDSVLTWGTTRNDILNNILISQDGRTSLVVITLESPPEAGFGTPDWLRANLAPTDLDISVTGLPVVSDDFRHVGHSDLVRAELISLPITLVLLVVIFRGVIPAILPVALAACSMILTLAAMSVVGRHATVNVFTVNAVTMLGLAVGIDYALIMVSRFREEITYRPREEALAVTFATAGRTVATAGSTVAIGLSGLLFFDVPAATTTALLGALVVLAAVVLALVALPAALAMLAGRMAGTAPRGRPARLLPRIESVRRRHPVVTLVLCLAVLAILTAPVLGIRLVSPGLENLPASTESRSTAEVIQQQFPLTSISPIEIVIQPERGSMLESRNLERYQQLTQRIANHPSIQRVESLWTFVPAGFNASTLSTGFMLEPDLVMASQPFLTPTAALMTIYPMTSLSDNELHVLVRDLRSDLEGDPAEGLQVLVGGRLALDVDVLDHVANRTPVVVAWVVVFTAAALFLHLRSLVLPFKAILLNLASMGASFGMLAWIFQDGNLASLLNAEATGSTVMLVPVLMFCFLFGLGMDFEVIMLSRIREGWLEHGDTTRAVNSGLERAAGIVTASAMLMLAVFLAFAFSELDVMKALGIGLAIAVVIDATIIRLLLLPATMQLMGRWNWWPSRR
jgi:RND superfamily putative drug exporter